MNKYIFSLVFFLLFKSSFSQQNIGLTFQGIARDTKGFIISDKVMNLRISILADTLDTNNFYQELTSVKTDHLGYFSTIIGNESNGKIITNGSFESIRWDTTQLYVQVEIDLDNNLQFTSMGFEKITAAPLAYAAKMIDAKNIKGIVPIEKGGTGTNSLDVFKNALGWDSKFNKSDTVSLSNRINLKLNKTDTTTISNRINLKLNRTDFNKDTLIKMLSNTSLDIDTTYLSNRINLKLNKSDTISLSNRINLKLNRADFNKDTLIKMLSNTPLDIDTSYLSNRINLKLNKTDTTSLSNRINLKLNRTEFNADSISKMINYTSRIIEFGSFYDTSRQFAAINTATAVVWNFSNSRNNISISNNSSGLPTKINNITAGTFEVVFQLQFIKSDNTNDDISIWIRKNGSAYPFTNKNTTILGNNVKNIISGSYYVDLGSTDYIELFYSVKSSSTILQNTASQSSPSRPMTPSAAIQICKIN
jgi:hypothetical protein